MPFRTSLPSDSPLLIIGASARAAAESAHRSGLRPFAVDQFADVDLQAVAQVAEFVGSFPGDLVRVCQSLPPMPWMYLGGLENQPAIVEQIASRHRLLGVPAAALRRIRDPWELERVCRQNGIAFPDVQATIKNSDENSKWLWKGTQSSAGLQVCHANRRPEQAIGYYQRRLTGVPMSVGFLSHGGNVVLLGISQQLIGAEFYAPRPFQYAGNIAPVIVSAELERQLRQWGTQLTAEFSLQGLWGCDFLLEGNDPWLLEINSRYCASFELYERAFGCKLVRSHVAACTAQPASLDDLDILLKSRRNSPAAANRSDRGCFGKLVVYATGRGRFPLGFEEQLIAVNQSAEHPRFADISPSGTDFEAGSPLVTVFAEGRNPEEVAAGLRAARLDFLARLQVSSK